MVTSYRAGAKTQGVKTGPDPASPSNSAQTLAGIVKILGNGMHVSCVGTWVGAALMTRMALLLLVLTRADKACHWPQF